VALVEKNYVGGGVGKQYNDKEDAAKKQ